MFFSLQFVARETWSDSSDFPDWTLSDINHDHSTMNLVALQKQWEQNRSDVSKAQTTWFDSLQYWHRFTLGRSYLYAGNQLAPWQWRVYRNLTSKCKGGALSLDENWDVIFKSPVVSCRTFAMSCCRWLGILLYHWCFDWKEATDTWPPWKITCLQLDGFEFQLPVAIYIYIYNIFLLQEVVLWILPGCDFSLGISWGAKRNDQPVASGGTFDLQNLSEMMGFCRTGLSGCWPFIWCKTWTSFGTTMIGTQFCCSPQTLYRI